MKKISKFQKNKKLINSLLAGVFAISALPASAAPKNSYMVEDTNGNKTEVITDTHYRFLSDAQKELNQFCFQLESGSTNLQSLQDYMEDVRELSNFTKELYKQVKDSNTYFCETGEMASKNTMASFTKDYNVITLQNVDDEDGMMLINHIIHEMVHAVQNSEKALNTGTNWDLESRLKKTLATEAAANIGVVIAAFEIRQDNNRELWNSLEGIASHPLNKSALTVELLQNFESNYAAGIEAGKDHIASINAAGEDGWKEIVAKSNLWRQDYSMTGIDQYIAKVIKKKYRADEVESGMPSNEQIANIGKISTNYNFSQNLELESFIIDGQDSLDKLPKVFLDKIEEVEALRAKTGKRAKTPKS